MSQLDLNSKAEVTFLFNGKYFLETDQGNWIVLLHATQDEVSVIQPYDGELHQLTSFGQYTGCLKIVDLTGSDARILEEQYSDEIKK